MRVDGWHPLTFSEMQDDPEQPDCREPKFFPFFSLNVLNALQETSLLFSADTDLEAAPRRDVILKAICDFKAAMYF